MNTIIRNAGPGYIHWLRKYHEYIGYQLDEVWASLVHR